MLITRFQILYRSIFPDNSTKRIRHKFAVWLAGSSLGDYVLADIVL